MAKRPNRLRKQKFSLGSTLLTIFFTILSLFWLFPVWEVLINSVKHNDYIRLEPFQLPNSETFTGFANYLKGLTVGNYPFLKSAGYSVLISVVSTALILLFCSMSGWYIARVQSRGAKIFYYLCLFSMIVPFQMVMFTLTTTADQLKLNTPWTIPIIYLGFGAGLAIFMFVGFVKGLPLEIEEAAAIDGCGPVQTFFMVVMPMLKPTLISVGILELMWVWNDYLLPLLVLGASGDIRTIPLAVQGFNGSFVKQWNLIMVSTLLAMLPILILYLFLQKYIVAGVTAGAVKG